MAARGKPGRPKKQINVGTSPVADFALSLRRLRADAGSPTYRQMSERVHYAHNVLSQADSGYRLPTDEVLEAYVTACGGDTVLWRQRLRQAREAMAPRPDSAPLRITRTLTADRADFTGRATELGYLYTLLPTPESPPATVVVSGLGGVGKTALAVHAAHKLSPYFPDIQLQVDLLGFGPSCQPPADPASVLADLLVVLGVPTDQIPTSPQARAALYRDRLAGRRALILLDDVANEGQVRPLLPGSPGCFVLVTSRSRLTGLDDAQHLVLDTFPPRDALTLFTRIVGEPRRLAEPAVATEICELVGGLAIAITVVGGRLKARPAWSLESLARSLRDEHARLAELETGDRSVQAAFNVSYHPLTEQTRRVFRLLAVHPGEDVTVESVAALADLDLATASRTMECLLDVSLVQQASPGRYRMHDLVRAYARERGRGEDPPEVRREALHRVISWYLHSAHSARALLYPGIRPLPLADGTTPRNPLAFDDHQAALAWCEAERAALTAAVAAAASNDLPDLAWQLPRVLLEFYDLRKHWNDWIDTHQVALAAATRAADPAARAHILHGLGGAYRHLDRYEEALDHCREALTLWRQTDDRSGEAGTLNFLGVVYRNLMRYDESVETYRRGLQLYREIGYRYGEGIILNNLGDVCREWGRFEEAIDYFQQAVPLRRETGHRFGEGHTYDGLGATHLAVGDLDRALPLLRRALEIRRDIGDRWGTAETLDTLGRAHRALGEDRTALDCWAESAAIFDQLDAARAAAVRGRAGRSASVGTLRPVGA
ncbi:hypothetical protein GCM10027290_54000 [Micromonospora sonneratiae]|uniref:ATP-binding protein n=1 Tax=Micromonospora sonneratiae TaxID=1184706 RepID=A0ABW3YFQ0_9ACTN